MGILSKHFTIVLLVFFTIFTLPHPVSAEGMMTSGMSCPMCGAMGWGGMVLGTLLMIAVIVALLSFALFLFRKTRPRT